MALEILDPTRELKLDGVTYTVRELPWKLHLALLRLIAQRAGELLTPGEGLRIDGKTLVTIITGADELCDFLLTHAVTTPAEGDWRTPLPARVVIELIGVAVDLNFTEEIVGQAKNVGGRVAVALGMRRAASPSPTTS